MKIPKKIKIAGFIWTIHTNGDVSTEGNCYGSTHHRTQKIFLEPGNSPQRTELTFLHEILHAVWEQYGLGGIKELDKDEEKIIKALGSGLYQVLKDNKFLK